MLLNFATYFAYLQEFSFCKKSSYKKYKNILPLLSTKIQKNPFIDVVGAYL